MEIASPSPRDDASAPACQNCGHALAATDLYCGHCGQETHLALPTARQFMRDAAGRYVALDGRLGRTLRALMLKPGLLTLEYFSGRRRRYIRPGRLFLVTSIVAFAAIRFAAHGPLEIITDARAPQGAARVPGGKAAQGGAPAKDSATAGAALVAGARDDDKGEIVNSEDFELTIDPDLKLGVRDARSLLPGPLRERVDAYNALPRDARVRQIMSNMLRYGPYAAIALLPAFALLLMALYPLRNRRYPQRPRRFAGHLIFAAHNHAFLFVLLVVLIALPQNGVLEAVAMVWGIVYLLRALRAVYGGGWLTTSLRAFALFVLYLVLFAFVTVGLLFAAILLQ
jgi:Protein of unknown function (DUF3667)